MEKQSNSLLQSTTNQKHNQDNAEDNTLSSHSMNIIMHHLGSFQNNNLDAVVSDYTNESVLITHESTFTGREEIKTFFANLMIHFPKLNSSFELDKVVVIDRLGYIVWHANTPSLEVILGTDTFIIKDDKIFQQTFCGQIKFK